MLRTKTDGEFLIQEIDIDDESQSNQEVILISDQEDNTKNKLEEKKQKSQNKSSSSAKKQKKAADKHKIQCKNKFFSKIDFQNEQLMEKKPNEQSILNFGQSAKQISVQKVVKQAEKFYKQLTWSDNKKSASIPEQLLPDEIQDIQFFIPKIKGVNDQICTNTLYLNKIKDKIQTTNVIPDKLVQLKPQSREQFVQQLRNIQFNQIKNHKQLN